MSSPTFNDIYDNRMGNHTKSYPVTEFAYMIDCITMVSDKAEQVSEFRQYDYHGLLKRLFKQETKDIIRLKKYQLNSFLKGYLIGFHDIDYLTPEITFKLGGIVYGLSIESELLDNWENFNIWLVDYTPTETGELKTFFISKEDFKLKVPVLIAT